MASFVGAEFARERLVAVVLGMVVSCTLALPDGAHAQESGEAAALVVFKLEGSSETKELRDALTNVIREEAGSSSDYQLVNDNPILLSDTVVVLGCKSVSTTCLGKAAEHFDADYLVFGKVEDVEGRTRVSVRLFDPGKGRYIRSFGRVITKISEPYSTFRQKVQELFRAKAGPVQTVLEIQSNVEGAEVQVDGNVLGRTPLTREGLSPGRHEIQVDAEGHQPWGTKVELVRNETTEVRATLQPTGEGEGAAAGPSGPTDSNGGPERRYSGASRIGPWVAIGVGAVAFGGAAYADSKRIESEQELKKYRRENRDATERCETERECNILEKGENAETALRVLIGVGGVSVASGLLWLWFRTLGDGGAQQKAAARRLQFSVSGQGLSIGWRW